MVVENIFRTPEFCIITFQCRVKVQIRNVHYSETFCKTEALQRTRVATLLSPRGNLVLQTAKNNLQINM